MSCKHLNIGASIEFQRIVKTGQELVDDAEVEGFAMDISVGCVDCNQPFRFKWSEDAIYDRIPLGLEMMKKRPWISFGNGTLGVMIEPDNGSMPEGRRISINAPTTGNKQ